MADARSVALTVIDSEGGEGAEEKENEVMSRLGSNGGKVRLLGGGGGDADGELSAASEEAMLLWGIQQPTLAKPNAFVSQLSVLLPIEACVMWDSEVVLGKFLEHAVDSGMLLLQYKKVVELGSGCGLAGCIAALLGAQVVLTDLPDRLRLLKRNVEANLRHGNLRSSALVKELTWGCDPDRDLMEPLPDYVLGSDAIYSEEAVEDLLETLLQLCGTQTTIVLAGELRNDQAEFHPDYCSQ